MQEPAGLAGYKLTEPEVKTEIKCPGWENKKMVSFCIEFSSFAGYLTSPALCPVGYRHGTGQWSESGTCIGAVTQDRHRADPKRSIACDGGRRNGYASEGASQDLDQQSTSTTGDGDGNGYENCRAPKDGSGWCHDEADPVADYRIW